MDTYRNLNGYTNINNFNNIFECFEDMCVFSMGCLFPTCLFGRIYEISGFGKCITGCCILFPSFEFEQDNKQIVSKIKYFIRTNIII